MVWSIINNPFYHPVDISTTVFPIPVPYNITLTHVIRYTYTITSNEINV